MTDISDEPLTASISNVAVVTGGAGFLGGAIADSLAAGGCQVALADVTEPKIRSPHACFLLDVTDDEACAEFPSQVVNQFGKPVDIVVNCAGVMLRGSMENLDLEAARRVHDINVWGAQRLTRGFVRSMKTNGFGRIINISSIQSWKGLEQYSAYAASKAALDALTRVWARELGSFGITVNSVAPGYVDAPMIDGLFALRAKLAGCTPEEARRALLAEVAIGRLINPMEVGAAVSFLASPAASAINGVTLAVDGGNALL